MRTAAGFTAVPIFHIALQKPAADGLPARDTFSKIMKPALAIALSLFTILNAHAAVPLTFYDGFDYTTGANLGGVGDWTAASGAGTIKAGAANLSYAGLTNGTGKDVILIPGGSAVRVALNFTAQTAGTVYFSFLLKVNTQPGTQSLVAYASSSSSSDTTPALGFFIKLDGTLGVGINTATPQFSSAPINVGQTYLVVAGYTFGASDTVEVWVNPTSLGGSAPAVTGSFTATHNASLSYFLWNTTSGVGGSCEVDELRIGSSYAAVTPASGVVPPAPSNLPRITQTLVNPGSVILRGTNGTPNTGFEILSSTNVALSPAQWSVIGSNTFNGSGNFDTTNGVVAGPAPQFYRLRLGGSTNVTPATPPVITSQPQSQSAAVGQGALFSVTVTGTAPLSYQWFFNTNTPIVDATNATHTLSGVVSNDAGAYSVTITNSAGATNSALATLTISPAATNGDFYVSTTGSDANPGTLAAPFATVAKAISVAGPGNLIYVRGGTYFPSQTINITNSGTPGNLIKLWAYPGELPFLDFVNQPYNDNNRGFRFTTNGNYWHMKGFEIARAGDNAIKVEGSHSIFELLVLHDNGDSGLQIGFGHPAVNNINLAAFITVINCDSYGNYDPNSNGGDADGFAAKLHCGQGIIFIGCRAWENSDDGWDLFETDASVVISNCWTWKSAPFGQGNGNGFKLGGDGTGGSSKGTHYAYNCVSFGHKVNGFTQNSHKDGLVVQHCVSFSNGTSGYNYYMEGSLNSGKQNVFKNNVGIQRPTPGGNFIADNGSVELNNSWNLAVTANAADFGSLLEAAAKAPRKPDGSLPDGFAQLVAGSDLIDQGANVGLPFIGSAPDLGPYEYSP